MKVTRNWLKQYVGFDWSPGQFTNRFTVLALTFGGTEWREEIAHGVSRGLWVLRCASPGGATEGLLQPASRFLSSLRGWRGFASLTHGLRRGLLSVAAPRLNAVAALIAVCMTFSEPPSVDAAELKTKNVFLLTTDGLRWEEVFRGIEQIPLTKEYGNYGNSNTLKTNFWRETIEARREALFPFLWGTVARNGQLWGNRNIGSDVRVTNGRNFSYPGYNEFLTGYADPKIDSNDKKLNVNTNVFEWLHSKAAFRDRVAAAINWDVLPWILNAPRAGFPVWSGFAVPEGTKLLPVPEALTQMVEHGRTVWSGVLLDTFVGYAAQHAVRTLKPRAMYVSFGETDDWAHEGHYERYLKAAHEFDRFLAALWNLTQSLPEYRGTTTFLITVDHGRGPAPVAWRNHGKEIADSAYMWLAVIGPDTAPLGERTHTPLVKQAQVAATVAAFLREDFHAAFPQSSPPIAEIVGHR